MSVKISAKDVASLRAQTGAGMMDCKKALTEAEGDIGKALDALRTKGIASAEKRANRSASEGIVANYMHFNGRIGVMVEVNCETDFVARTDDFAELAKDIAIHVASANPMGLNESDIPAEVVTREKAIYEQQVAEQGKPEKVREKIVEGKIKKFFSERVLLQQAFVKDDKKTIGELVTEAGARLGENIQVKRFARFEIGVDE
jgi:elongation factor Ts